MCKALPAFHAISGCDSTSALSGIEEQLQLTNLGIFCSVRRSRRMRCSHAPTSDSLHHHLKRANYQAMVWKRSLEAIQELPSPEDNGWERAGNNELKAVLMTKDPAPSSLLKLTICNCRSGCQRNCSCSNNGLSCSESCFCMADSDCRNPHAVRLDDSSESNDSDSD
ncbi:hypothetical protein QZH41_010165 [Actinostola sp. cb2023]|nr:hypothetical protein QZH41_010165 [Actinostola sp. cb2023]